MFSKKIKKKICWLGSPPMFVDRNLVSSDAYLSLATTACYIVYGIFLTKRVMKNAGDYDNPNWYITNNGKIQFTCKEALEKYGLSNYRFDNAIEELSRVGLIDIVKRGKYRDPALYSISERWKLYGTKDFIIKNVPKNLPTGGFKKGNKYGRNFSEEERLEYHQQQKAPEINKLENKLKELKLQKQLTYSDKKKNTARHHSIIDAAIDFCMQKLERLKS